MSSAKLFDENGCRVVVFNHGGTFTMDDLRPSYFQDYDNGKTMALFNTYDPVSLAAGAGGRKLCPSVIALFSDVTIDDSNAFNDGYIVASNFHSSNTHQQRHGNP